MLVILVRIYIYIYIINKIKDPEEFDTFFNDLDIRKCGEITFDEFLRGLKWLKKVYF